MCIVTPTASYSTCQDQFTHATMERFQVLYTPFQVTEDTVINITNVISNQTATICEIHSNYGYLDYTLEKCAWEKTIFKNGARSLPTNKGRLFFFENELSGSMTDFKVGDAVTFDIRHVKTSNKLIATCVRQVVVVDEIDRLAKAIASQLASINSMVPAKMMSTYTGEKFTTIGKGKVASISELHHNYGVVDYPLKDTSRVPFHSSDLFSTIFTTLKQNDVVQFDLVRNNVTGKHLAKNVQFLESTPARSTYTGHFIDMQEPTPVATTAQTLIKIAAGVTGHLQSVEACFAIVDYDGTSVFLPEMALFNTHISELTIGDVMKFDIYFNAKNGKHVGKNVELFEKVNALKKFGHFQFMQPQQFAPQVCKLEKVGKGIATGNVVTVAMDHAILECTAGSVYVYEGELVGTHITEIHENDLMTVEIFKNTANGKLIGKNVSKAVGVKTPVHVTETPIFDSIQDSYRLALRKELEETSKELGQKLDGIPKSSLLMPSKTHSPRASLVSSRRGSFAPGAKASNETEVKSMANIARPIPRMR